MDNVRLCDRKLVCIPRKEYREMEVEVIPCQAHCRSHQATSPEEDLKVG